MLYVTLSLFQQPRAMSVILAMLVMVLLVDALSSWLRTRLA
jgi:phosphonate transport system permease protein